FVPDRSEWTTATHVKTSLQADLCAEPLFQVLPGLDLIAQRGCAVSNGIQMALQDFVHQPLLVLEIVIKLTLSGAGTFDDLIRARRPNSLAVEQVGRGLQDPKSCIGPLG